MTLIDFQVLGSQLNHESNLPQVSKSDCSSVVVSLTVMLPQRLNPVSLGVCVCVCVCVCLEESGWGGGGGCQYDPPPSEKPGVSLSE